MIEEVGEADGESDCLNLKSLNFRSFLPTFCSPAASNPTRRLAGGEEKNQARGFRNGFPSSQLRK